MVISTLDMDESHKHVIKSNIIEDWQEIVAKVSSQVFRFNTVSEVSKEKKKWKLRC